MHFEQTHIEDVIEIAIAAGEAVGDVYKTNFRVDEKADGSLVTKADQIAETIILEGLNTIRPDIAVLSEEAASHGNINKIGETLGKQFFLVDPLDGTRDFVNRTDEFSINIALINDNEPVFGVIYAPLLKELFYGLKGDQAFKRDLQTGSDHPINARTAPDEGLVMVTSRMNQPVWQGKKLEGIEISGHHVAGSSLKFCRLAEGKADIYPRFGRTMEWDTAAGQVILEAAGGSVKLHPSGERLLYKKASRGFDNPAFIARGRL